MEECKCVCVCVREKEGVWECAFELKRLSEVVSETGDERRKGWVLNECMCTREHERGWGFPCLPHEFYFCLGMDRRWVKLQAELNKVSCVCVCVSGGLWQGSIIMRWGAVVVIIHDIFSMRLNICAKELNQKCYAKRKIVWSKSFHLSVKRKLLFTFSYFRHMYSIV